MAFSHGSSGSAAVSEVYVLEGLETPPITLESIINAEDEKCKSDKAIKEFRRNYDNTDAYLEANGKRIKIKGFIGRFRPSYTQVDRLEINPEVIGVIEYILQKQKTMVMRQDGHVMVKILPLK